MHEILFKEKLSHYYTIKITFIFVILFCILFPILMAYFVHKHIDISFISTENRIQLCIIIPIEENFEKPPFPHTFTV